MTVQRIVVKSWRKVFLAVAVSAGGALAGLSFAPPSAEAATGVVGSWTCYGTDACHAGTYACCDDGSFDHCTNQCPIIIRPG